MEILPRSVQEWAQGGEFVVVESERIFTRQLGDHGPAVVLLHGFPGSSHDWRDVSLLDSFAPECRPAGEELQAMVALIRRGGGDRLLSVRAVICLSAPGISSDGPPRSSSSPARW